MPEQDLFLTNSHRFVIKYDSREEENPLFSSKFWGFEMYVNVPKAFSTESLGEKQYEFRGAVKEMLTDYILQRRNHLSISGFISWVNGNPGYTRFLRNSGLGELKLDHFSKLYYQDTFSGEGFDHTSKKENLFSKEYVIKKFKAERLVKREGDRKVVTEDEDYNYVISLEFEDVECKIDSPISETYVKFALQEIANLFAERCSFKDISKRTIIAFANKCFSKKLGIKIVDIGAINVNKIENGETLANFNHNYIKGRDIEI